VREYSSTDDNPFWCCVGTGMESHAKHGDSIFWEGQDDLLYVNLYIPAEARWAARGVRIELDTRYPFEPDVRLTLREVRDGRFALALRIPAWATGAATVQVNDSVVDLKLERGYAMLDRTWRAGDRIALSLPLELRTEAMPGDAGTVAVLRGPLVLAADLGDASTEWHDADPALVGDAPLRGFAAKDITQARYVAQGVARPADVDFVPFYRQYRRRSAVYFRTGTAQVWAQQSAAWQAERARQQEADARAIDVLRLGEAQAEHEHALSSDRSYTVVYRGRHGRDARSGGFLEFTLRCAPGPLVLQATYWSDEHARDFDLLLDGQRVATQHLDSDARGRFFDVDYPLDAALTAGKSSVRVRIAPREGSSAGPVYGVRLSAR
jgi:hypothetical protein